MSTADPLVTVCRDPKDHQRARVPLSALDGFAFDSFSHGARSQFARPMLVAFVAPADIVDGELRRPASHGVPPDRMKVAITRTHNQTVYPMMERAAAAARLAQLGPPPRQRTRRDPPPIPTGAAVACPYDIDGMRIRPRVPKPAEVAALRASTGLTIRDFAARFNVDPATLARWELGVSVPRPTGRAVLARIKREIEAAEATLHPGATRHSG